MIFRSYQMETWILNLSGLKTTIKKFMLRLTDAWQKTHSEKSNQEMSTLELVGQKLFLVQ